MTSSPTNAFAVFGFEPTMEIDRDDLESRYLAESRASHPDFHTQSDPEAQATALRRSADVNDAYRILRDPWKRAEACIEARDPGALEATKTLDGMFLMEAMELAEEVAEASPDAHDALRARIEPSVDAFLASIRSALASGDTREAATLVHKARYSRKALRDLDASE